MSKKHKQPKTVIAAVNKAAREEEIVLYGKPIAFRTILQSSKKKYNRKQKHKEHYA